MIVGYRGRHLHGAKKRMETGGKFWWNSIERGKYTRSGGKERCKRGRKLVASDSKMFRI